MDLENLTVVELKAMVFDEEQRIKVCQSNIQILYKKLEEKLAKRAKAPKEKEAEVKEVKKEIKKK